MWVEGEATGLAITYCWPHSYSNRLQEISDILEKASFAKVGIINPRQRKEPQLLDHRRRLLLNSTRIIKQFDSGIKDYSMVPTSPKADMPDWEQEQLESESEVTLVKFDSELSETGQQPSLNNILQKYTIEQRVNFLINRDLGLITDISTGQVVETFRRNGPVLAPKHPPTGDQTPLKGSSGKKEPRGNLVLAYREGPSVGEGQKAVRNIWDDYWQQTEQVHKVLLMSICQKNNKQFSDLFNRKLNHVPININYKSFDNWTPIHFAALHGNNYALEYLLSMPEIYVNSLTNFKLSALHVAAKNNKTDSVRLLIKAGIELNYQDEDGFTALHYAVELGHKEVVGVLLNQKGIRLDIRNNIGLHAKEMNHSADIQRLFMALEGTDNNPGFFANLRNNRQIEKLLMKVNQNFNKTSKVTEPSSVSPTRKRQSLHSQSNNNSNKKPEGKRQNMVKMYQLLKEKKSSQKISIDAFKFYKKIGEGAFGEVYIVKKGKSEKLYALKAIKKQSVLGTNLRRYIQTQKQVLSLIKHPFIVGLHFAFQNQNYLFLVMDYCEGGDLGKSLEKNKKFDEVTVKKYAAEMLLALQALHREKIIYRDLKPENIVLDSEGHALLTDFGLSKKTDNIDDINKSFCGTPAYLPLEIINRKGHNRMADWYEYGIVLYELYVGLPPFYAETRAELYQNVRAAIIRFPRGTPENFRDLIKKLLSQNPQKRLGFVNDAESVKEHPWFNDIDWDDVYNRKLQMPRIQNRVVIGEPIKTKFVDDKSDRNALEGWSFIASV